MSVLFIPMPRQLTRLLTRLLTRVSPAATAALLIVGVAAATILGAYFFEYGLGFAPCPLCLEQRVPYYITVPLAALVAAGALKEAPQPLILSGLVLLAVLALANAALGAFHAGVEWRLWPGPQDCTGPIEKLGSAADLLRQMQSTSIVRCDEPAWRFLGLSLAGYNVLISLFLAAIAIWGLVAMEFGRTPRP